MVRPQRVRFQNDSVNDGTQIANNSGTANPHDDIQRREGSIQNHGQIQNQAYNQIVNGNINIYGSPSTNPHNNSLPKPVDRGQLVDIAMDIFNLPAKDKTRRLAEEVMAKLDFESEIARIWQYRMTQQEENATVAVQQLKKEFQGTVDKCLESLSFLGMDDRAASISRPSQKTCEWIYEDSGFVWWTRKPNRLLWLKGKPGSGKSILMKSLFAALEQRDNSDSTLFLQFFFNARGGPLERTLLGLYIKLMHDLVSEDPIMLCQMLLRFKEKESYNRGGMVHWSATELADTFHDYIGRKLSYQVTILIDALDECNDDEVRDVVRRFENSISAAIESGAALRVCWSSRFYPHISLRSPHGVELYLDDHNSADIVRHVEEAFPRPLDSELGSLMKHVTERARGVFLWAEMVTRRLLKAIDQGRNLEDLMMVLDSVPQELDDLFVQIFDEVWIATGSQYQQPFLINVAYWILCSCRPLTLEELYTALKLQASKYPWTLETATAEGLDRLRRRINDASGGLFEVVASKKQNIVQVIHESVRDFFFGKGKRFLLVTSKDQFYNTGDCEIAVTCFRGLLTPGFEFPGWSELDQGCSSRASSVEEDFSRRLRPWDPPENPFLRDYVQNFIFQHFGRARIQFSNENPTPCSPLTSSSIRREALLNFLRICCSEISHSTSLRADFNKHFGEVSEDPSAFGITSAELVGLMSLFNNVVAASKFLSSRSITLFRDMNFKVSDKRQIEFVILFCFKPSSIYRISPDRRTLSPPDMTGLNSVFAFRILAPVQVGSRLFLHDRFRKSKKPDQHLDEIILLITLTEWSIISDLATIETSFPDTHHWATLPQTHIHLAGQGDLVGFLYYNSTDLAPEQASIADSVTRLQYIDQGFERIGLAWRWLASGQPDAFELTEYPDSEEEHERRFLSVRPVAEIGDSDYLLEPFD